MTSSMENLSVTAAEVQDLVLIFFFLLLTVVFICLIAC